MLLESSSSGFVMVRPQQLYTLPAHYSSGVSPASQQGNTCLGRSLTRDLKPTWSQKVQGEFTSGYCIRKGKAIKKLRVISGLLVKVICLPIAEDVYMGRYSLQTASSSGYNYSVYKGSYILDQLRVASQDHPELRYRVREQ
ncbi:hypothetical protein TNCV_4324701 [Trichonephila clavipes]|nr:hypothetical protein TNCV_4324701 [Trichonephila clavipes]